MAGTYYKFQSSDVIRPIPVRPNAIPSITPPTPGSGKEPTPSYLSDHETELIRRYNDHSISDSTGRYASDSEMSFNRVHRAQPAPVSRPAQSAFSHVSLDQTGVMSSAAYGQPHHPQGMYRAFPIAYNNGGDSSGTSDYDIPVPSTSTTALNESGGGRVQSSQEARNPFLPQVVSVPGRGPPRHKSVTPTSGYTHSLRLATQQHSDGYNNQPPQPVSAVEYKKTETSGAEQHFNGYQSNPLYSMPPVQNFQSHQPHAKEFSSPEGHHPGNGGAYHQQCTTSVASSMSQGSQNSSGVHVTPSPSDSGIAELEAAIRDRDVEMNQLRKTMEQNEQVMVRLSQENEQKWHAKMREWATRLEQSVATEQRLLNQIQQLQDERRFLQNQSEDLNNQKSAIHRKFRDMESAYLDLKQRFKEQSRWAYCQSCGGTVNIAPANGYSEEPQKNGDLRREVDQLRGEVTFLKNTIRQGK